MDSFLKAFLVLMKAFEVLCLWCWQQLGKERSLINGTICRAVGSNKSTIRSLKKERSQALVNVSQTNNVAVTADFCSEIISERESHPCCVLMHF